MSQSTDDIFELARLMRMDLSQLQARLTDLTTMIAGLNITSPTEWACDKCGLAFPNRLQMLDHLAGIHDDQAALLEREKAWADLESIAVTDG